MALLVCAVAPTKWSSALDAAPKALVVWRQSPRDEVKAFAEDGLQVIPGLLDVQLVELQVPQGGFVRKILVPLSPQVARWWTDAPGEQFSARVETKLTKNPRIHIFVTGGEPLQVDGVAIEGIHTVVELPPDAILEECQVGSFRTHVNVGPLAELGPIRALTVVCKVKATEPRGVIPMLKEALDRDHPLRWLSLPWLLLLMPFFWGYSMGPVALVMGALLTLAGIACISFLMAIVILLVQQRCMNCFRRYRRLWRLRTLARRPKHIAAAFGDTGPCCICLAEPDRREMLIALLPCRHALHSECYSSWVCADSYPSHDLLCPLCRCRADAIGKLEPLGLVSAA